MYSVGHQLMKARQARRLCVEDVAFETRIPHQRLRDMENDDLSNFANLTYAKGFLKLYSRFLNLDLSEYLDEFDTSAISAATGHEYVHTASAVRLLSAPMIAPDEENRGRGSAALGLAALAAVLLGGGWLFYKSQPPNPTTTPDPVVSAAARSANTGRDSTAGAAADSPAESRTTTLAKVEPSAMAAPESPPPASSPPKAEIVPPDATVRKATPVDDEGNEIARPRL